MAGNRRGSVYLAVVAVIAAVTVLTLTGVALRGHIHERAGVGVEAQAARQLAHSAGEWAAAIADDSGDKFVEIAATGSLFSNSSLGPGRVTATVTDLDTGLTPTPATDAYRVVTDARVGEARSRLALSLERPEDPLTRWIRATGSAVAYWPLNETDTLTAIDSIGGRHGVYGVKSAAGGTTHAHGNKAPRVYWNTESVRVDHNTAFELADGTLAFWVRFDLKPTTDGVTVAAVSKEFNTRGSSIFLAVYMDKSDIYFMMDNVSGAGKTIKTSSGSKIVQGQWHHVAVTWGAEGMWMYIDGKKVQDSKGDKIGLNGNLLALRPANTAPWYFGVRNIQSGIYQQSAPTIGSVARVALFNRQLVEIEVYDMYQQSSLIPGLRVVPGSFASVTD